ncbi:carbohydrate kinase family protein [Anditalea andensis]|uniref:Carbohydrate kinase PfkB domain-containing protein n=1 Tax=Anditalea andensis TaxID=1048983 RepID=A0A074KXG7_9BACT|nr:carbohydrate kinase [Anditalea andensis]KEO74661.1 hypothetical protein EL17_03010 [Anditalea andensis]
MKKIVCFGEVLWDLFGDKHLPGGAPMNVALNLNQLGFHSQMISKVGNDLSGKELLVYLKKRKMDMHLLSQDKNLPTGKVIVDDSDHQNVKYDIVAPVAWDAIEWTEATQNAVDKAEAFIYGSLAARDVISAVTLNKLLSTTTLKIFDINIRAPHYKMNQMEDLLRQADILKVNQEEVQLLAEYHNFSSELNIASEKLAEAYGLKMVCITRGSDGALLYYQGKYYEHPSYQVVVKDTVGSGDAFLSGLVYSYLHNMSPHKMLNFACAMGALVATHQGATPTYSLQDINSIIDHGA